jgi:tetratricopeptide (TPR) repeat protein
MFGQAFMNHATRFAAWVTPHVKEWHRQRHADRLEGERHLAAGNYSEAEKHLTTAVALAVERRAAPGKRVALRLQLAEAQRELGNFDHAEASVRTALDEAARDKQWRAVALDALAEIQLARGNFADAEKTIAQTAGFPSDPASTARRTLKLARAQYQGGDRSKGLNGYAQAVELHEKAFGAEHVETGHLLAELGTLGRALGNHAEAQTNLRRALKIHEACFGADSREAAEDLSQLAASLEESGDLEGAMAQYERALRLNERRVGANMEEVAEMQARVAKMYIQWGEIGKARQLMAQAIPALVNRPGPRRATALEILAELEEASGNLDEAASIRAALSAAAEESRIETI